MRNIAILASHNGSGFDTLYQAYLDKILDINISLVISNNTNAPVLEKAKKRNIKAVLVNSKTDINPDETIFNLLKESGCEIVVLVGYMKKISPKVANTFQLINSHPALLPKHGGIGMYGRRVHDAVIKAKDKKSGVTVHEVNENYDDGKIILQQELRIVDGETPESLETKIKKLEKTIIVEALQKCLK